MQQVCPGPRPHVGGRFVTETRPHVAAEGASTVSGHRGAAGQHLRENGSTVAYFAF